MSDSSIKVHYNEKPLKIWIFFLLLVCVSVNLGLFAWGINRGLDIKDESFMLTCYRFPHLYAELTSSFHLIVDRFFGPFDFGLLQYRIAGLALRLLSATILAWGLWRWLCALPAASSERVMIDETRENA